MRGVNDHHPLSPKFFLAARFQIPMRLRGLEETL